MKDVAVEFKVVGLEDVVGAYKKLEQEQAKNRNNANNSAKDQGLLNSALNDMKGLLPQLGIAAAVTGLGMMAKHALDTADGIGKLAAKTGMSAESLSVFSFAARTADVEQEALNKSFVKFARTMDEVDSGSKKATGAVQELLGTSTALNGLSMDDRLRKVVDALGKLEPGSRKTALAVEFFGKQGADLIPLLDDMGGNFDEVKKKAEAMGLVISTDLATAAQKANDAMTDLKSSVEGAAVQFVTGLAPAIQGISEGLLDATSSEGVNGVKKLGEIVGDVARGIVSAFVIVGKVVGSILGTLFVYWGKQFDKIATGYELLKQGRIFEAGKMFGKGVAGSFGLSGDWKDSFLAGFTGLGDEISASMDKIWNPDATPGERKKGKAGGGASDAAKKQKSDIEKARRDLEQAWRDNADKLAKARADADAAANERAYKLEKLSLEEYFDKKLSLIEEEYQRERKKLDDEITELLAMQAKETDEARRLALEREIESRRTAISVLDIAQPGSVQGIQDEREAAKFSRGMGGYSDALGSLDLEKQRIQNEVTAGKITEEEATKRIVELERERVPLLREMLATIQATTPEQQLQVDQAIANLDAMAAANQRTADSAFTLRQAIAQETFATLNTFLTDTIFKVDSVGDAFKQLGISILTTVQQAIAQLLLMKLVMAMFGPAGAGIGAGGLGGALFGAGFAEGGYTGDGGKHEPAGIVHRGEYVFDAATVRRAGIGTMVQVHRHLRGYADGGLVGASSGAATDALQGSAFDGAVTVGLDDGLVLKKLESSAAGRIMVKHLSKQPKAANQALGRK